MQGPENFDEIYLRYSHLLYGYIFSVVRDEKLAVKVFTATFVDAFKNIHLHDPEKLRFYSWLRQQANLHMQTVAKFPADILQEC